MNFGVLLFVLVLSAVACKADEPSVRADTADVAAAAPGAAPGADGAVVDADDSGKFFLFAQRSITVSFTVTTSKSEILKTCFSVSSAVACNGRRRRRFVKMDRSYSPDDVKDNLDSSLSVPIDDDNEVADPKDGPAKNSKYFFTLWETSTSTLVVVSTSTNAVNVVSVSAACTLPGSTYPGCM